MMIFSVLVRRGTALHTAHNPKYNPRMHNPPNGERWQWRRVEAPGRSQANGAVIGQVEHY
jgi:hypothetical protein